MELAFHLKAFDHLTTAPDRFVEHLTEFYGKKINNITNSYKDLFQYHGRIYIGNEFCIHRLPLTDELKKIKKENIKITLLTPPLTDKDFKKCARLLDYLAGFAKTEIVINDWGFLIFIKKNYPEFKVSAGRLLNKGFKDPRFLKNKKDEFLALSTFDNTIFRQKMIKLGISRLEQDLLPYKNSVKSCLKDDSLEKSFYFPFGYITTGRMCLPAVLKAKKKFAITKKCKRPCHNRLFELEDNSFLFSLFQKGNTIFYLYPASMLISFIQKAKKENVRMIYQGFGL